MTRYLISVASSDHVQNGASGGPHRGKTLIRSINESKMKRSIIADGSKLKFGLDTGIALGLAGAVVFFLISGGVAYFNLRTLRDDNQKIVHSHEVITTLDELLSGAQNAETGQRGYLF